MCAHCDEYDKARHLVEQTHIRLLTIDEVEWLRQFLLNEKAAFVDAVVEANLR